MTRTLFLLVIVSFVFAFPSSANYTTPGTQVKYTLSDLVANAGGNVTLTGGVFTVHDTITVAVNDTLSITSDATVKFAAGTFFDINGTIIINPPTGVLFTAQEIATGYLGMRLNTSPASLIKKLTFEYAVSLRISDCSVTIDSSTFRFNNNNASTAFGNGAIALFRSNSIITNCRFLDNQRAAIQGGANISNAPRIVNCLFMGNNTTNQNVPQINLGTTGTDTARILNNQILRASTRSGGIGFLPIGNVYVVIAGNTIKNNRYGITLNGGSNINARISNNVIDSNNTEGNPNLGGSGISFTGGSSTSHQNTVVTGNYIRWNLWGITIGTTTTGGGAKPNLGDLTNTDTTDDGRNWIYGNTNSTTPNIEIYNNNVDDIMAQNNYWGSNDLSTIEARIFHRPDNGALGLINYTNYIALPVNLGALNARLVNQRVLLSWRTLSENNVAFFAIEKSGDGRTFHPIGRVVAVGSSSSMREYGFSDSTVADNKQFYRLQLVDKDNRFSYSNVVWLDPKGTHKTFVHLYPTHLSPSQPFTVQIMSEKAQSISMQLLTPDGRIIQEFSKRLASGTNTFLFHAPSTVPSGMILVRRSGGSLNSTIPVFMQ